MTLERRKNRDCRILVAFTLLVLGAVAPKVVEPIAEKTRFTYRPDPERDQASGVATVFNGLRMSLADMCYNKSSYYQHRGARYRKLEEDFLSDQIREDAESEAAPDRGTSPSAAAGKDTQPRESLRKGSDNGHHEDAGHDHTAHDHEVVPLILTPEEDFRGIIGEVERQVKPYSREHVDHIKGQERQSLPWLRLATWINPDHDMAWIAMAFWLQATKQEHKALEAIELLERARALNRPRENEPYRKQALLYMLGHLYLIEADNPRKAREILEESYELGTRDFDELDPVQRDWLNFCVRDLVQSCRRLGLHQSAIDYCTSGILLFPDDGTLYRVRTREQALLDAKKPK